LGKILLPIIVETAAGSLSTVVAQHLPVKLVGALKAQVELGRAMGSK